MPDAQIKSVNIEIASADLETLKNGKYQLCFAKKVNDTYNVVWQSADAYLSNNTFSWQPLYQLFGSNEFKGDVGVHVATNQVSIGLGEQATIDSGGVLGEASSGGPATAITMVNDYGPIHPGLCAYSTDIQGNSTTTPIYVAEDPIVSGSDTLTPVESVQVWFEQDVKTSTMFSTARSNSVEIDLTEHDSATRLYSDGGWSTPKSSAFSVDPVSIMLLVATLTAAVVVHDLATKITSKLTGVYKDIKVDVGMVAGNVITIEYREQPGLSGARLSQTQLLLLNPTTVDQLTGITLDAFAQLGVGYVQLAANASA
ncbi:hypothetical protein [Amycolatopsis magusensis]|uniref:Uncharacterized protein n=1 Tax=Amycolatopsis magusensis TaxID=882444 RepID=A0ABS4PT09_9PSEU|nr:hypothetical protein [Amycolatopsis magusensis]MBP2182569.1 hypothetical protein [Amycolatopsis magusensis]MDI5980314.1 hypothetical protein [Amycolatopsis magusensis]